ncbi:MAG: hypothetical protein SGJ11_13950 [Phycisphaerae bacterium]|nr:hypothetical protein [Phycisphaerae bacterium]
MISATSPWRADLNGDNYADLLWRNSANGNINGWLLKNTAKIGGGLVAPAVASQWRFAMRADLDNDGDDDLVWQNTTTGQINGWKMKGLTKQASAILMNPGEVWLPIP